MENDVYEIRRANLRFIAKALTRTKMADIVETSVAQLNHIIGKNPIRNPGERLIRKWERKLKLGDGELDHDEFAIRSDWPLIERVGHSLSLKRIPVIGFAVATPDEDGYFDDMGFPPGAGETYLRWPTRDPNAYALRVKNDSMAPRIRPGELIVIEPGTNVNSGDDVLVKTRKGRKMVKQLLYQRGGEATLGSINSAHKTLTISIAEIESMHFIGAIVPRGADIEEHVPPEETE